MAEKRWTVGRLLTVAEMTTERDGWFDDDPYYAPGGEWEKLPRHTPMEALQQTFEALGRPESTGLAFAITRKAANELGLTIDTLPRPDYEHRIWLDRLTDNFIVARPDANGVYNSVLLHNEPVR